MEGGLVGEWLATWTANPEVRGSNPVRAGNIYETLQCLPPSQLDVLGKKFLEVSENVSASLKISENIIVISSH